MKQITNKIYSIRNQQVMLDEDLAFLYGVQTKVLNQAVKRNPERFPEDFCFKITREESNILRSQIVTLNALHGDNNAELSTNLLRSQIVTSKGKGGRQYLPHAFTEQGIAMLSAVLKSDIAIKVSISIMNAFISMRRIIADNAEVYVRLDAVERKQIQTDQKIEKVLNAYAAQNTIPPEKIFFDGEVFDAHALVSQIIRTADRRIILIDNYIDETVLQLFTKRKDGVAVSIFTKKISQTLKQDIDKFNTQYPPIEIKVFDKSHDRFLIIDDTDVYHFGASLKDLGKKWFAVTKLNLSALSLLLKI
jgi:hypothetical protein